MRLTGSIDILAPPADVWTLVVDPLALASCVPGVREMRQVDERTFAGSISASVGPMEGDFAFTSRVDESAFPVLAVQMDGTDSVTKSRLGSTVSVRLSDGASGGTTLRYDATVDIKGRLAIVGEMILRATASAMIAQVARCLRARVEAQAPAADRGGVPSP